MEVTLQLIYQFSFDIIFWLFPGCVIWDFDVYDIMFLGKILIIREFSHSKLIILKLEITSIWLNEFPNKQIFSDQFHFNQLLIGAGKWQERSFSFSFGNSNFLSKIYSFLNSILLVLIKLTKMFKMFLWCRIKSRWAWIM